MTENRWVDDASRPVKKVERVHAMNGSVNVLPTIKLSFSESHPSTGNIDNVEIHASGSDDEEARRNFDYSIIRFLQLGRDKDGGFRKD